MKTNLKTVAASMLFVCTFLNIGNAADVGVDPRTNSWLTTYSSQYARIYTNDTMKSTGTTLTTWSNGSESQALPSYCGVQEVYSSSNWVYLRTTGLGSHIMGPWYLDSNHNRLFPNLPVNQKVLWRFPRTNGVPATKAANGGGTIGYFVDGVAFFNSWDAYYWNTTYQYDTNVGSGYWNRDAYINEGVSFDAGYAHQEQTGTHHYHADPIALRYQLGDHVDFNATTKTYSESTNTPTKHSPILAWTVDGYPLYGPYGYSNATNANSGIRRMVSGYVLRDGNYGTSNLTANGRKTIPAWSARLFNVSSNQLGPSVQGQYTLGRYMEDNDYLGDHSYVQGTDFDLDEYNGRYCVTPEFPGGTYAYFVAIASNGTPAFPYNIGRGFRGSPVGGAISAITESVTTNFLGNTNAISTMNSPVAKNGAVTLTWSAIEGGTYQVDATTNFSSWTTLATGVSPNQITGGYTNVTSVDKRFYRAGRTGIASFDSPGVTVFGTSAVAPGGSASRGQTVIMTITLPTTPMNPPANAPTPTVTLAGSISGANISRPTTNTVTATFVIPSNSATNAQDVVVTFSPMPTYTLSGGFTINP